MERPIILFQKRSSSDKPLSLLGPIGTRDATVDVSICGVAMFIELPKIAFT